MKKNKKRNRIMLLLILLLGITVGFAALATTLKINGNANITKNTWSVYWDEDSIAVTQGSKGDTIPDVVNGEDGSINTKVNWNVNLEVPGDFYEFTIDAVNAGTIDAMITGITPTLPQDLPSYVSYSVTYADGVEPAQYHLLPKGTKSGSTITPTTEKYKVRIEFLNTITPEQMDAIPEDGLSFDFGYEVQYGQADENGIDRNAFNPQLGDYFTLAPDATTASTSYVGFSGTTPTSDQTLWRVIKINNDKTIDAVSEYVSSSGITIEDSSGYLNYVAGLQDIASKYAKNGYTVSTRMMGYDGQTATIPVSKLPDNNDPAPSTNDTPSPTTGTGEEYDGGFLGDTLYLKDYQSVSNIYSSDTETYGTSGLKAYDISGNLTGYWIPSREYQYWGGDDFMLSARYFSYGSLQSVILYGINNKMEIDPPIESFGVRPIITIKNDVTTNGGDGTKLNPYTFE